MSGRSELRIWMCVCYDYNFHIKIILNSFLFHLLLRIMRKQKRMAKSALAIDISLILLRKSHSHLGPFRTEHSLLCKTFCPAIMSSGLVFTVAIITDISHFLSRKFIYLSEFSGGSIRFVSTDIGPARKWRHDKENRSKNSTAFCLTKLLENRTFGPVHCLK